MATRLVEFHVGDTYDVTVISEPGVSLVGALFRLTLWDGDVEVLVLIQNAGDGPYDDLSQNIVVMTIDSVKSSNLLPKRYRIGVVRTLPAAIPIVHTLADTTLKVLPRA
jgi:hypothetical protein